MGVGLLGFPISNDRMAGVLPACDWSGGVVLEKRNGIDLFILVNRWRRFFLDIDVFLQ